MPALPDLQRMGMSVPDHPHRGDTSNRPGKGQVVLKGVSGSETERSAGMPALPLHVHRRGAGEYRNKLSRNVKNQCHCLYNTIFLLFNVYCLVPLQRTYIQTIMGSVKNIDISRNIRPIHTVRSKGERLGWKNMSEERKRSLKEIVGEGEKVNRRNYCFFTHTTKLLIP